MQVPDDKNFELYLKSFGARMPNPLPLARRSSALRQLALAGVLAMGAAALLFLAVFGIYFRHGKFQFMRPRESSQQAGQSLAAQPLTIRAANARLRSSSSFKAAMDAMAVEPQSVPLPKDTFSSLTVLSKEKTKL